MDKEQKKSLNLNMLFFFSQLGFNYYALLLPAIALFYANNIYELKITISIYFFFTAILQIFPEIVTQQIGFRNSIFIYFSIFLIGSIMGLFYQGDFWIIACSRALQAIGLSVLPLLIKSLMFLDTKRVKSYMIMREILSGLSGPGIAVVFGYLLHFYGWRICYLLLIIMYSCALLWFYFQLDDVDLGGGHKKSIKNQFINTLSIFKHKQLVMLIFCSILTMSLKIFIYCVYAFVFLHDFHMPVYYVGYIPLFLVLGGYTSLLFIPLQNKISIDKLIIFFLIVQVIILFFFWQQPITEWFTLTAWLLLNFTVGICYVYLNELMAQIARELKMSVQLNTLYYFLRNFIPLIAVLVWTNLGHGKNIDMVAEILFSMGLLSFIFFLVFKYTYKK